MMITAATQADALLQKKLDSVTATQADYVVSSNIGCAMHLAGGLRRARVNAQVIHPISLLAQQLRLSE
jgi:glycolate oxidase iron-sulfur subunit